MVPKLVCRGVAGSKTESTALRTGAYRTQNWTHLGDVVRLMAPRYVAHNAGARRVGDPVARFCFSRHQPAEEGGGTDADARLPGRTREVVGCGAPPNPLWEQEVTGSNPVAPIGSTHGLTSGYGVRFFCAPNARYAFRYAFLATTAASCTLLSSFITAKSASFVACW